MKIRILISIALAFSSAHSFARQDGCEHVEFANAIQQLSGLTRLKNCEIEIVSRTDDSDLLTYFLLIDNQKPLASGERIPAVFEFSIPRYCLAHLKTVSHRYFQYSSGFVLGGIDFRRSIQIRLDHDFKPKFLQVQLLDLNSHVLNNRIVCGEED